MTTNFQTRPHSHEPPRKSRRFLPYFLFFLTAAGLAFVYFLYLERTAVSPPPVSPVVVFKEETAGEQRVETTLPTGAVNAPGRPVSIETPPEKPSPGNLVEASEPGGRQSSSPAVEAVAPSHHPATIAECEHAVSTITDFYSHLDSQDYLKSYQLGQPTALYFSALIQKAVNNPPIVTGETDDLFSILKNTAHFFRIIGKKNIFVLKAILDREKDSFEKVLADFYKLTDHPEYLQQGFSLDIKQDALYDYAGFFLNTMGGRLYLFRRDSVSRLAVSYYSILIIDKANDNGQNKHGIDIIPAINTLISELENSGPKLRMKNSYLDTLYDLKEKYM